jgi:hypothetical protein
VAATLTDAGELTYMSFGIEKVEATPGGDLMCYGRASDGQLDHDDQIVDTQFSSKAISEWLATGGNVRVQHNAQRDPAGVGLEVNTDETGATWVKSLIVEREAKRLLAAGALRAYSVGIAHPTIVRDPVAKGGRITSGSICEISLVDRPSNARCGVTLVKSAGDGTPEYVGEVFGADDAIAKALDADLTKGADDDLVNVDLPKGASISISPGDFAKLHTFKQQLTVKAAGADTEKRDVSTAERRSLASEGNSLADGSYPIASAGDLHNAAHLARTGHGNAEAAKKLIARRARELGVANPLDDDGDSTSKGTVTDTGTMQADPEVTKDPPGDPKPKPVKKAKKKPKKLPPWLNKPSDDGGDPDDNEACKHAWIQTGSDNAVIRCEKCHTTPAEAAGLSGSHDMTAAPVPELLESPPVASTKASPTPQSASGAGEAPSMDPVPAHREPDGAIAEPFEKDANLPADGQGETPTRLEAGMMKSSPEVAAILRFKAAGIDTELGRLHDLTCPAFHPEDVAKHHPFADLRNVDEGYFQRAAVQAACGPSMELAKSVQLAWQAARVLKETDPGVLNDFRLAAHKAFRDANPGPSSAPTPGMMTPGRYSRPLITDGHEASSTGHDGPNTSPQVATTAPDAHSFDRPPLTSGHQSPSPSHMKQDFPYPDGTGRPQQLNYAVMEKERARQALMAMHEHLSRQFPEACPMSLDAPVAQPESRGVPATVGVGKSDAVPAMIDNGYVVPAVQAQVLKAPEDLGEFADAEVYKGFKRARKKLGKKVLSGKMTVDEARSRLGRQFAQKGTDGEQETVAKAATPVSSSLPGAEVAYNVSGTLDPEVIKSAVREALRAETVPLEPAEIKSFDPSPAIEAAVTKAMTPLLERIGAQDEALAENKRVLDALADQPDPSTAAFSGLAFNPVRKAARQAGVPTTAEIAERTQQMMIRHLQDKYNASSDPAEREAYYGTLSKMRGVGQ